MTRNWRVDMTIDIKLNGVLVGTENSNKTSNIKKSQDAQANIATEKTAATENAAGMSTHVSYLSNMMTAEAGDTNRINHLAKIKAQINNNSYRIDLDELADKLTHTILNK